MPSPKFFQHAGLFVVSNFLDEKSILEICKGMEGAPSEKAMVETKGGHVCLDETVRKATSIKVSEQIVSALKQKFVGLLPRLERHFKTQLAGCEKPVFLNYRESDFFAAHRDGGDLTERSEDSRRRRISAVIFLNRESDEPGDGVYGNGKLTFYGLLEGAEWEKCAFSLRPEPGLLIAFPSGMPHEVTHVSHGHRLTVVTWFYGPEGTTSEEAVRDR